MRLKCNQCQLMVINGVPCHEKGCPNRGINPATDRPYQKECRWCGSDFEPDGRFQDFCDDSCAESYNN